MHTAVTELDDCRVAPSSENKRNRTRSLEPKFHRRGWRDTRYMIYCDNTVRSWAELGGAIWNDGSFRRGAKLTGVKNCANHYGDV